MKIVAFANYGVAGMTASIAWICSILMRLRTIHFYLMNAEETALKGIGCLLLVSGFFVVLAALVLMRPFAAEMGFVAAGVAVEALGLGLLMNAHRTPVKEQR